MIYTDVVLDVSGNSVTLPSPTPGHDHEVEAVQALGETAAGDVYVYDKSFTRRFLRLRFRLTKAQRDALVAWYGTHAQGALNTCSYRDHHGITHTGCRVTRPLAFQRTAGGRYEIEIELRLNTTDPE